MERNEYIDTSDFLGYDILGYGWFEFHSYICNGYYDDFLNKFGIRPNQYGLYDSYADAKKAADCLWDEEMGAELALWQPWAVCKFNL